MPAEDLLTIIIPTHNRPKLLRRAVRSAMAALPAGGEIVVVDDRSESPAMESLSDYKSNSLRVVRNAGEPGASGARNFGAAIAVSSIMMFLDDDDELMPDYCFRTLAAANDQSRCGAGYAAIEFVDLDGTATLSQRSRLGTGPIPQNTSMRKRIAGTQMGFWIRSELFKELGGLKTSLSTDEDTDLTIRIAAKKGSLWYEAKPGVRHYAHLSGGLGGQLTNRTNKEQIAANYVKTYSDNAADFPANHEARWFLLRRALRRLLEAGDRDGARRLARSAVPRQLSLRARAYLSFQ